MRDKNEHIQRDGWKEKTQRERTSELKNAKNRKLN